MFGTPLYWRITHRQPRFILFDGRVVVLLLLTVMHIRFWTIGLSLTAMFLLWYFERKNISADSILRYLRARLVGPKRSARGFSAERSMVDFGWETPAMVEEQIRLERLLAERSGKVKAARAAKDGPRKAMLGKGAA